ncbi:MAG TPA: alkaline phosphatase PhoX [Actinophytocola sp.]|uniref:PhoX family protein n=1 Tax=Actinophytocola sp. TaxID=1872138 RepID=UPI002DDD2669|nr:alkaline phosphatase PhoX [Actinophytocola sp.]HEV2778930.1 alkaline phosphatase PhoX [Actinophytocola sp.]
MVELDRRSVLRGAAAAAGGAIVGGPFLGFVNRAQADRDGADGHRELRPIPDERDGAVRLWLPEGFRYRSFHDTEFPVRLDDGTNLPGRHDGMGAFATRTKGTYRLVRNHELNGPGTAFGDASKAYDPKAQGGTTTIEVTRFGEVVRSHTSLNGTQMNCSGGQMPWGSWISCEETVNGPDVGPDFTGVPNVALTQRHGFVFEVPVDGESDRRPITAAGRFAHESVAFDPHGGALYLTEDDFGFPSGFYRYTPRRNPMRTGRLDNDGRLQMLAVRGRPNLDLAADQPWRATYRVEWVDIDDPAPTFPFTPGQPAPTTNNDALTHVARQGWAQGAAYFSRLEGSAYDNGVVYFCSTQGGGPAETGIGPIADGYGNGSGQIWAYHTRSEVLQLLYQSPGPDVLDFPDNVTTSPRGTLVVCEDNVDNNFLRGLTRGGRLFDIALNRLVSSTGTPRFDDEFAGSTFSPDGHTLFVNIQASRGMSFAIWGPWHRIGV